jgi:hypothetical protein
MSLMIMLAGAGIAWGESMDLPSYPYLYFSLYSGATFVPGTVDSPDPTMADVKVGIDFADGPPDGKVTHMVVKFTYNADNWTLTNAVKRDTWPYTFDKYENPSTGGGTHTVVLTFYGVPAGGGITPPGPVMTFFADLYFTPVCLPEFSYIELPLDQNQGCNITITTETGSIDYVPESYWDGSAEIANYQATTDISDMTISRILGDETYISVPITCTTNFKSTTMEMSINYDATKLAFVELEDISSLFSFGCGGTCPSAGSNPINFSLINISCRAKLSEVTQLCKLKFRVLDCINGTTPITFNTGSCRIYVCSCPALSNPGQYTYTNGSVKVEKYKAHFQAVADASNPTVAKTGDDNAVIKLQLKNEFPAGLKSTDGTLPSPLPSPRIRSNFKLESNWSNISGVGSLQPNLEFDCVRRQSTNIASIFQLYKSSPSLSDNWLTTQADYVDIATASLQFVPSAFSPANYAGRFVPVRFVSIYNDGMGNSYASQVVDITGTQVVDSLYGLDWIDGQVEAWTGEFSVNASSSSSYSVSQTLKIRNNFDLTSFSLLLSAGSGFSITNVAINSAFTGKVAVSAQTFNSCTIASVAGSGFGISANGEAYTTIATITYSSCAIISSSEIISEGISKMVAYNSSPGPGIQYCTAGITLNGTMYNGSNLQYVVYSAGSVTARCCSNVSSDISITKDQTAGLPTQFMLYPNHPNPFNPETIVSYDVPKPSQVKITIVNILGQKVATLVDEPKTAGHYDVVWRGTDSRGARVSSGVYLCIMQADNYSKSIKMSLLK